MSSPTTPNSGAPRLVDQTHPSRLNRKTVVVEQKMVKAPTIVVQNPSNSWSREHSPSLDPSVRDSIGTPSKFSTEAHHSSHLTERSVTDQSAILSSPDSVRSSCSSLVDTASNISSAVPPSSESRILEYLQHQISHSATKIYQLEKEVQEIPNLRLEIDKLEKERTKLANDMFDSQELVKTMKQRISVLHEQNEQLAQLTSATRSESSEVMRIRNTLVASLAQLKQLQKQVDTIPALKSQIRVLVDENTQLREVESEKGKHSSVELPQRDEPLDYQALLRENDELRQVNAKHLETLAVLNQQVNATCEELKQQVEVQEGSKSVVQLLQERIKSLESEKDCLHQQIIELKLHGSGFIDVDTAYLTMEVAEVKKKNSQLKSQLEQHRIQSKLQKEQLVLKLFEVEKLKVRGQTYELEEQMLMIHGNTKIASPECMTGSQEDLYDCGSLPEPLPVVKQQLLKLHQLKLHYEQSRQLVQTMVAEKEELEKRVSDLTSKLEKHRVDELESQLVERENRLKIVYERVSHLEQHLSNSSDTNSDLTTLVSENKRLTHKLAELQVAYQQSIDIIKDLKDIEERQKHYETLQHTLQKAKDDKRKAEKRYKDVNGRLRSLAKELSTSAELLSNYQTQCARLHRDLESALAENNSMRSEAAVLKADLEVAKVEIKSRASRPAYEGNEVSSVLPSYEELSTENRKLENDLKRTIHKFQQQLELVKNENTMLSDEAVKSSALLETRRCELERKEKECGILREKVSEMEALLDSSCGAKKQLNVQLEALKGDCDQSSKEVARLHVQLKEVNQHLEDALNSKTNLKKLSERYKEDNTELLVNLKESKETISTLTRELAESKEARHEESLVQEMTNERLQKATELVHEHQKTKEGLELEIQSHRNELESLKQALAAKDEELECFHAKIEVACTEKERLTNLLKQTEAHTESRIVSLTEEKAELLSKLRHIEELSQVTQLESKLLKVNQELKVLQETRKSEKSEVDKLRQQSITLTGEIEGYKAMVDSLRQRLDEAETREIEHEQLRLKIKKLERLLGDSSHDNKTLVKLLHETVSELPTYSTEATKSLQDENLKLEEQVSVLSQWNDKQRQEIEDLENQNNHLQREKHQLLLDLTSKEGHVQENLQLKRELKEVEMEINMLRRQVRADVHEELQVKVETQTQLLSVFSQHNDSLRMQVEQLQEQVLGLGGELDKQTPVSPPPMPDMSSLTMPNGEEMRQRTWSDLGRENLILKQRIETMEEEVRKLHSMSSSVRRRSSTLHALSSVPVGTIHEELQIT